MNKSETMPDYTFWAGPEGRKVAARTLKLRRRVIRLRCVIGMLIVAVGVLVGYIYNL